MTRTIVHGAENYIGRQMMARLSGQHGADLIGISTADDAALTTAMPTADALVHCPVGSARVIAQAAKSVYAAAGRRSPPLRIVHLSSVTVYGGARGRISETSERGKNLGAYAAAHCGAEDLALQHGNAVILRAAAEYGPACQAWSGRIARLLHSRRLGDLGEAGDGLCNLTYINDLVDATAIALQLDSIGGEIFNIALDEKPTWNDYLVQFARALRAVPVKRISARRLKIERQILAPPLKILEIAASTIGKQRIETPPPLSSSLLQLCGQEFALDVGKAESVLRMSWTPLHEGLAAAAAYYRD